MEPLGGSYTDEEFAVLDPMRHAVNIQLKDLVPGQVATLGCAEKWTRGEDLAAGGCFVKFRGALWLEVTNGGGGACSTRWLKEHAPSVGWIGTEGKPNGFREASSVGQAETIAALAALGTQLLAGR